MLQNRNHVPVREFGAARRLSAMDCGIAAAVAGLRATSVVLDGEAVCCDDAGLADFEKLHSRAHDGSAILFAFDLLELEGVDYRPQVLEARKAALAKLLGKARTGVHLVEHIPGDGATIFKHACLMGLEGIVSKHRGHGYRSGPSKAWLKIKNPTAPLLALRMSQA